MKPPKTERFTDDCKKCGWCPEKENSAVPLGDCGLCFSCMDKFIETAVDNKDIHGCLTGDCPHEDVNNCVYSLGELVSEQAALLDARGGRIRRQNKQIMESGIRAAQADATIAALREQIAEVTAERDEAVKLKVVELAGKDARIAELEAVVGSWGGGS